jgi:hypothetical protein
LCPFEIRDFYDDNSSRLDVRSNTMIDGLNILKIAVISSYSAQIVFVTDGIIRRRRERKITKRKRKLTDIQGVGTQDKFWIIEFGYHIRMTLRIKFGACSFPPK